MRSISRGFTLAITIVATLLLAWTLASPIVYAAVPRLLEGSTADTTPGVSATFPEGVGQLMPGAGAYLDILGK